MATRAELRRSSVASSCIYARTLGTQLIKNKHVDGGTAHACHHNAGEAATGRWVDYRYSQPGLQRETLSRSTNTNEFGPNSVSFVLVFHVFIG